MGTRFEVVLASENESRTRPLLEAALHEIDEWHARLTRFQNDSLVSHINRVAAHKPVRLDDAMYELCTMALQVKRLSGGAFDITLGNGDIVLDERTRSIALTRVGTKLDFGAIAKGFALDRAADILRAGGVSRALLHGGTSSVLALGTPPGAHAWRLALAHGPQPHVVLRDSALSVSRPDAQLTNGIIHIIDARTGERVRRRSFAAVVGPSACLADAWSTAIAVLGHRPAELNSEWHVIVETAHA